MVTACVVHSRKGAWGAGRPRSENGIRENFFYAGQAGTRRDNVRFRRAAGTVHRCDGGAAALARRPCGQRATAHPALPPPFALVLHGAILAQPARAMHRTMVRGGRRGPVGMACTGHGGSGPDGTMVGSWPAVAVAAVAPCSGRLKARRAAGGRSPPRRARRVRGNATNSPDTSGDRDRRRRHRRLQHRLPPLQHGQDRCTAAREIRAHPRRHLARGRA